ncbi:hypothetical protein KVT40_006796 [Elsinoe batatas]|uniref:Uncharacterized protein n=1 Tax=Elsinoe batatas TaxID=2601811 RepID=A0A8K0L046_9PEZI|nr:hypothetical protein KVT40_006796 [Elsinoe batatas]
MDINSWLHELDTSRPPINTDPHVHRHQPRRKSPADSSILQYEGDRSEPRDLYQPRHTSHRHVVARRLAADERHGGHASISSATSRSAASVPHSASHPSQLYKRRPRHKTKQDRYDPKVRHVRQEPKGRHTEQKKSRSKRKSREARPESIQLEEHKPENVSGQRVTLKPSLRSGLFRQGISSLPARARTKPLDDLTFREAIFLDRNDQQKADDQTGGPKSKKPRHDQRERVIVQEQQYDDYFDQKTKFARREDCQVNRNRPQLNDELLPGRHGRQDTTETAASLPRQGTTLPTSKHRNTARASPGPPIAKLPSRSLPQHSEMSGLRIATSALERVPNVFTPPVSHLDTNAHWHDPETTSHQRHGQINRQTRPLVEYSESESSPDKMSPYWLHRPRHQWTCTLPQQLLRGLTADSQIIARRHIILSLRCRLSVIEEEYHRRAHSLASLMAGNHHRCPRVSSDLYARL